MEDLSGVELIAKERQEQLEKHDHSIEDDAEFNRSGQLSEAAAKLVCEDIVIDLATPRGWNNEYWQYVIHKSYEDRLIIAGALIAAEIDRLNYTKAT